MSQYIILNYHALADRESPQDPIYSVEIEAFKQQMAIIARLGIDVVPLTQLHKQAAAPGLKVVITFDDGHASDWDLAYPVLEEFGWKAAFFVPAQRFVDQPQLLEQYKRLAASGHCIGAHGFTHRYMTDLDATQQRQELQHSKQLLEALFCTEIESCALPGGKFNKTTIQIAQEIGYKHLLTTQFGMSSGTNPRFLLNRWTIKRATSFKQFESILRGNGFQIRKATLSSLVKKRIQGCLPNQLLDNLNYFMHT